MKILARMPPPTPAWPENKSIAAPPVLRNVLAGGRSVTGPNRPGNANRAAKIRYSAKNPGHYAAGEVSGGQLCGITPVTLPGPQSRRKRVSIFLARRYASEETSAAGRIVASQVPTATCAAWSAGVAASISP